MGADKDIPTVFQSQNIQLRKLTWSARAVGPSGGTSVHHTPSCLLRPRREGLRGKHLRSHQGNTPAFGVSACHLLAFVGLCWMRPLEFRTSVGQEKWTTAYLALEHPCYLPRITNALEVPHMASRMYFHAPKLPLIAIPFFLDFCPSCPNSYFLGVYSPRRTLRTTSPSKPPYSPSSPAVGGNLCP